MLFIFGFVYCPRYQIRIMASDAEKTDLQHPLIQDFAKARFIGFLKTSLLSLVVALLAAGLGYLLDQKLGLNLVFTFTFLVISYFGLQIHLFFHARKSAQSSLKKTP